MLEFLHLYRSDTQLMTAICRRVWLYECMDEWRDEEMELKPLPSSPLIKWEE
jgi:hypothetical protein